MTSKRSDMAARRELVDVLLDAYLITPEQLAAAQTSTAEGGDVIETLIAQDVIAPRDVAMAFSLQVNLPLIELKRHTVQPQAISLIPEEIASRYKVIPMDVIDGELVVVMENPLDIQALEDIRIRAGMSIRPTVGVRDDIEDAINIYYRSRTEIERQLGQIQPETNGTAQTQRLTVETVVENPVARAVELILNQAIRDRASDVHIVPDEHSLRVRYRIDGILHDTLEPPLSVHRPLISRIKVLAGMNIAEQRRPQDGQFVFRQNDIEVDVRVGTANTVRGEMAVLRILDKSVSLLQLDQLGFLPESLIKYQELIALPFGMILVAGPTGAGKTTSLYATLNQLDRDEYNILTIEDPVEYQFDRIGQMQVNRQAGLTFATGLRSIMRMDPNVILVGEIRDRETAEITVQAALTGHLVLSSIHANDAVGALHRLIDLGVEPFLVASALVGVVSQRLVRNICPHCRNTAAVGLEEQMAYSSEIGRAPDEFYQGQGCNFCAETGYLGRVGVFEVLSHSETIRRMLMQNASADDLKEQAIKEGMVTMWRDGMLKVQQGITTPSEVMRNVYTI